MSVILATVSAVKPEARASNFNLGGDTAMTWDVKLGLLAGAGVVLTVALVFHRPDDKAKADDAKGKKAATAQRAASLSPMLPARGTE